MAPIWVTEVRPGIAKWIYFVGFTITAIASWLLRDYSDQALQHIPEVCHLLWPDIDSTAQSAAAQPIGGLTSCCLPLHCEQRSPVEMPACCSAASGALPVLITQTCPTAEQVAGCVLLALQQIASILPSLE